MRCASTSRNRRLYILYFLPFLQDSKTSSYTCWTILGVYQAARLNSRGHAKQNNIHVSRADVQEDTCRPMYFCPWFAGRWQKEIAQPVQHHLTTFILYERFGRIMIRTRVNRRWTRTWDEEIFQSFSTLSHTHRLSHVSFISRQPDDCEILGHHLSSLNWTWIKIQWRVASCGLQFFNISTTQTLTQLEL